MRWKIVGADRETGESRVFWIEADTDGAARERAVGHGLLISSIEREIEQPATQQVQFPSVMQVSLTKQQLKYLKVTPWIIAKGVFFGLLLWAAAGLILMIVFWVLTAIVAVNAF